MKQLLLISILLLTSCTQTKTICYFRSEKAYNEIWQSVGKQPGGYVYPGGAAWFSQRDTIPPEQIQKAKPFTFSIDRTEKWKVYRIWPDAVCVSCR